MRIPEGLTSLVDDGIIEEVVRPLMSGKEAQVFLVIAGGEERVAKIYKDAEQRSFKHRAAYTEGRGTRNTRDQRAIAKRTAHGRAQDEAAWKSTEVNMISRLQRAGVRVPEAYSFTDGVLVMELVRGADGYPAPRLGDVELSVDAARAIYDILIRAVVKMLCAGVVHGDLSDFNVLLAADGPVLIDFPQAVDSARNPNARNLLLRDVDNLHDFLGRHVKGAQRPHYAEEMWQLHEANALTPDTPLTGRYVQSHRRADTRSVEALIHDASRDERRRRDALGLRGGPQLPARAPRPQQAEQPQHGRPQPQHGRPQPQPQHGRPQPQPQHGRPQHGRPHPQQPHPQHGRSQQPPLQHPHPQQPHQQHGRPQQPQQPQHPHARPPQQPQHPHARPPQQPQHPHARPQEQQQHPHARPQQHPHARPQQQPQHPHARPQQQPQHPHARPQQQPRPQGQPPHPPHPAGAPQQPGPPSGRSRRRRRRRPPA
ncbi:MAG: hypothetical protein IT370_17025 [Deltaproteobacteria bacterium]|nr:hypothetical protein [Deltaproteobacteria bacterium]